LSWFFGKEVNMRVSDVMNRDVATVSSDASLVEAAGVMRTRNIGLLPVVEEGKVVGVLTDRDIVIRSVYEDQSPVTTRVQDVMTPTSIWCYEEDVLTDAAKVLADHQIRRLLVFDRRKNLVGLLSLDDLAARMSSDRLLGSVLRQVTAAAA
jgi:CBS domain-containing protein